MTPPDSASPRVLHLVDLAAEPDPLLRLAAGLDGTREVMARRFDDPLLRWRASREVRRRDAATVVAWGEAAAGVVRRVPGDGRSVYRPGAGANRPALPWPGATAAADSEPQAARLRRHGWAAANVRVVPPPVIFGDELARSDIGAAAGDVLWLAAAEGDDSAGLRAAVWAAAVVHVVDRAPPGNRLHRLLVVGDGRAHRLAKRFADQLGLPALCLGITRPAYAYAYADAARLADAALLLPAGPTGTFSARVAAACGLPAVVNSQAEVTATLAGRPGVRVVADPKPRVIAREMLRLETGGPAAPPQENATEVAAAWRAALRGA